MEPLSLLPLGVYRHFKGGLYTITGFARDSETLAVVVEYKHEDDGSKWVRPLHTPPSHDGKPYGWLDVAVDDDGQAHQRYTYVGPTL